MQDFNNYIGKLDTSESDLTRVDLYNYFGLVADSLNSRPYGLRSLTNNIGNKLLLSKATLGILTIG